MLASGLWGSTSRSRPSRESDAEGCGAKSFFVDQERVAKIERCCVGAVGPQETDESWVPCQPQGGELRLWHVSALASRRRKYKPWSKQK